MQELRESQNEKNQLFRNEIDSIKLYIENLEVYKSYYSVLSSQTNFSLFYLTQKERLIEKEELARLKEKLDILYENTNPQMLEELKNRLLALELSGGGGGSDAHRDLITLKLKLNKANGK